MKSSEIAARSSLVVAVVLLMLASSMVNEGTLAETVTY